MGACSKVANFKNLAKYEIEETFANQTSIDFSGLRRAQHSLWLVSLQVQIKPLVPRDELLDHRGVMRVGLVVHHPTSRDNLQLATVE